MLTIGGCVCAVHRGGRLRDRLEPGDALTLRLIEVLARKIVEAESLRSAVRPARNWPEKELIMEGDVPAAEDVLLRPAGTDDDTPNHTVSAHRDGRVQILSQPAHLPDARGNELPGDCHGCRGPPDCRGRCDDHVAVAGGRAAGRVRRGSARGRVSDATLRTDCPGSGWALGRRG